MGEKHRSAASCTSPTGDMPAAQVHALDRNRTRDPSVCRPTLYPLSQTSFGYLNVVLIRIFLIANEVVFVLPSFYNQKFVTELSQLPLTGCAMMIGGWLGGGMWIHESTVLPFLVGLATVNIDHLG
uniref:Uncharacterized protein n=1 Tax=Myotis myotis TaxID=51298 RepID=A0A7J7TII5_MYOMY|nr:hypothetical protein mMyoMyo1_009089 [Myotis myotis]